LAERIVVLGLEEPGIDFEQHVACLDLRAFLEGRFHEVAGDAGADLHRLGRRGPAGEVGVVDHLP
jgi:hypothetical protein